MVHYGEKLAVLIDETDEAAHTEGNYRGKIRDFEAKVATFTIDGTEYELPPGLYTATDILTETGHSHTPGGDVLYIIVGDPPDGFRNLSGTECITLEDGMEFAARTKEPNAEHYFRNLSGDRLPSPYREDDRTPREIEQNIVKIINDNLGETYE